MLLFIYTYTETVCKILGKVGSAQKSGISALCSEATRLVKLTRFAVLSVLLITKILITRSVAISALFQCVPTKYSEKCGVLYWVY